MSVVDAFPFPLADPAGQDGGIILGPPHDAGVDAAPAPRRDGGIVTPRDALIFVPRHDAGRHPPIDPRRHP